MKIHCKNQTAHKTKKVPFFSLTLFHLLPPTNGSSVGNEKTHIHIKWQLMCAPLISYVPILAALSWWIIKHFVAVVLMQRDVIFRKWILRVHLQWNDRMAHDGGGNGVINIINDKCAKLCAHIRRRTDGWCAGRYNGCVKAEHACICDRILCTTRDMKRSARLANVWANGSFFWTTQKNMGWF